MATIEEPVDIESTDVKTVFVVDHNGVYIGGFCGVEPPDGTIAVDTPPQDARQLWSFEESEWSAPPLTAYVIAKTTPWLRMTDQEAERVSEAIAMAPAKQRGIYDAATYISSADELYPILKNVLSSALGSKNRADELLAPETGVT